MKVEVLIDSLDHDGRRLAPGEVIEVEHPEALLALGAVRPAAEEYPRMGDMDATDPRSPVPGAAGTGRKRK
ncbi:MAG TPA: hypothetical protein VNN55_08960 [bacterium]|nr:hypothetical protein [bacterium]